MNSSWQWSLSAVALAFLGHVPLSSAQPASGQRAMTGAQLYRQACVACHGPDGRGAPAAIVGFETPLPDFTDCRYSTSEPDADWSAIVHGGGPIRALDRRMPAFGDALSESEIEAVVTHLREFCGDRAWPRGELNLPRALVTEKAFPESEALVTMAVPTSPTDFVETRFIYEQRIGPRSQYEIAVPLNAARTSNGWNRGLGDVAIAFKHVVVHSLRRGSILSAGSEMTFPTGKESEGLGRRLRIFEPFAVFGQILPKDAFLQVQAGFEFPLNIETADNEFYWRAAVGKTFTEPRWGRAWSPMIEVLGVRELVADEEAAWDLVPQVQVTLSRRQHVMVNAGVRLPLNQRRRSPTVTAYVLWDWLDGGLFSGW